jgi:hypothetical protein|nr:MAG TPA: hypothetical protein [Caudoviricetes sp.]
MSKVILILDIMCTIISAVLVIVNVCEGDFGVAILWNMNFTLWICNVALGLAQEKKEKITTKLKEKDDEKE